MNEIQNNGYIVIDKNRVQTELFLGVDYKVDLHLLYGQDEPNLTLSFANVMELSCPIGNKSLVSHRKKNFSKAKTGFPKVSFLVFALKNLFRVKQISVYPFARDADE